jgi:hypothetical protein
VDLSYNHIETFLVSSAAFSLAERNTPPDNVELELQGNPLLCDCFAMELKQMLTTGEAFSIRNPDAVTCGANSPPELVNRSLLAVKYEVSEYLSPAVEEQKFFL